MALAPVAADVDQALDVLAHLPAEVTLDGQLALDDLAQAIDLLVREVAHLLARIDVRPLQD